MVKKKKKKKKKKEKIVILNQYSQMLIKVRI